MSVKIRLEHGLPFISVTVCYRGKSLTLDDVLLDTGSAGTLFSADQLDDVGIHIERGDEIYMIRGVGGGEYVFGKEVETLIVDGVASGPFEIEIGAMKYGRKMDGIVGMNLLTKLSARINLADMELSLGSEI